MKVIFLDFDGVITTEKSKWKLDLDKMKLVKEICDKTGSKIVISSSWRTNNLESTIKYITDTSNYFVGEHPFLMPELVVGITGRMFYQNYSFPRGVEVMCYQYDHPEIDNYVILDDDNDFLISQKDNYIRTDAYNGINEEDVKKAIEILNRYD